MVTDGVPDKGAGAAAAALAAAAAVAFSMEPTLASKDEKEMALLAIPGSCCGCGWPFDPFDPPVPPLPPPLAEDDGVAAGFLE